MVLVHPGGWHLLMHTARALGLRFYCAGVELVAKVLGGHDGRAAARSNYKRTHRVLTVTYKSMYRAEKEATMGAEKGAEGGDREGSENASEMGRLKKPQREPGTTVGGGGLDVERDVVPWLTAKAKRNITIKL